MKLFQISHTETSIQEYNNLDEVKSRWDSFLPENHHLKTSELRIFESCGLKDLSFAYLLIIRNEETIGVIYLQLANFSSGNFNPEILDKAGISLFKDLILKQKAIFIVCGNLFRLDSQSFYFKNKEDEKLIFSLLEKFKKSHIPTCSFSGILIKDVSSKLDKKGAGNERFSLYEKDKIMELPIDSNWFTFNNYLENLTKKYRQRANKIIKEGAEIERRKIDSIDFVKYGDRIEDLYLNVVDKQLIKIGFLNKNYFEQMLLNPKFEILGYFLNDKLLAFSSYIFHSEFETEVHYIGFDKDYNEQYALYFNILFDGIKTAIDHKASTLKFGRTGYDAKASVGANAVLANHFYKISRGISSIFVKLLVKSFLEKEEGKLVVRNPFKNRQTLESQL